MTMCWRRWRAASSPGRCSTSSAGAIAGGRSAVAPSAGGHHPHMASAAPAEVIARQLLENIQRQRRGLPLKNPGQ